eukprot:tig00000190_g13838.t1
MEFLRRDLQQQSSDGDVDVGTAEAARHARSAPGDHTPPRTRSTGLPPLAGAALASGTSPPLSGMAPPGARSSGASHGHSLPEAGAAFRVPSNAPSLSSSSSLSSFGGPGGHSATLLRPAGPAGAAAAGAGAGSPGATALQLRRPSGLSGLRPGRRQRRRRRAALGPLSPLSPLTPLSPPLRSAGEPDSSPSALPLAGGRGPSPSPPGTARTRRKPVSAESLVPRTSPTPLGPLLLAPAAVAPGRRASAADAPRPAPALSVGPEPSDPPSPSLRPALSPFELVGVSPRHRHQRGASPSRSGSPEEREADLRSQLSRAAEENASLRTQRDDLMKELQGFYQRRAALEEDLGRTRAELQRARERCEELSRELAAAREELGTVRREADLLKELHREVQERSAENEYLAQLLEESIAPIFLLDDAGRVVLWSRCMEECTGYGREEVLGRPFVDAFVADESREFVREKLAEAGKENADPNSSADAGAGAKIASGPAPNLKRIAPVQARRDPPAPPRARMEPSHNNKQIKLSRPGLPRPEAPLPLTFPAQFEFAALVKEDPDGSRIRSFSAADDPAAAGSEAGPFGASFRVETPPSSFGSLLGGAGGGGGGGGPSDAGGSRRSSAASTGRPRTLGAGSGTPSGGLQVPVELLVTATRHAGRGRVPGGICCIGQDLSEKQRAVSLLLGSISHECKTPLHHIVSSVQLMLQRCDDDPELAEYLRIVESSSTHLLRLINAILEYARVESGAIALHEVPMDVHALVEDVAAASAPGAQAKGLELSAHVDAARVPRFLVGDSDKLRQVLLNLLSNAVKCTFNGEVSVAVTAAPGGASASELQLCFTVSDTGTGIKASDRGKLFRFFSQLDMTLGKQIPGTGLGLAISHRLVRRMGGSISVSSEEGRGSVFTVSVPLRVQKSPPPVVRQRLELCVAVCEAAPWARAAASEYLHYLGAHVHEPGVRYEDGVEAVLCGLAPNEADPDSVLPSVAAAREAAGAAGAPVVVAVNVALLGEVHAQIRESAREAPPGSPGGALSPLNVEGPAGDGAGDWAGVFVVPKPLRHRELEAAMRRAAAWLRRHPPPPGSASALGSTSAPRPAPAPAPVRSFGAGSGGLAHMGLEGAGPGVHSWRAPHAPSSPVASGASTPLQKPPRAASKPLSVPSISVARSGSSVGVPLPRPPGPAPLNVSPPVITTLDVGGPSRARSASADEIVPPAGLRLAPPQIQGGRSPSPRRASAPDSAPFRRRRSRVLIVDDNPINLKLLRRFLEKEGYDCVSAADGLEGVDAFTEAAASLDTQFDAVLMDLYMPNCNGYEATSRIRAFENDDLRARTPIIACTANILPGDRDSVIAAGMDDLITKPLRAPVLFEVLRRWTGAVAQERARRASEAGASEGGAGPEEAPRA